MKWGKAKSRALRQVVEQHLDLKDRFEELVTRVAALEEDFGDVAALAALEEGRAPPYEENTRLRDALETIRVGTMARGLMLTHEDIERIAAGALKVPIEPRIGDSP